MGGFDIKFCNVIKHFELNPSEFTVTISKKIGLNKLLIILTYSLVELVLIFFYFLSKLPFEIFVLQKQNRIDS